MNWYLETWWKVIARPIFFFTKLKDENWKESSLSFLLITAWVLAAAITLAIFILQYIPIGSTLIEGISGFKFIIILPVLLTLSLAFFVITFLILGGVMVVGLGVAFYLIALLLHFLFLAWGGKGKLNRMLQLAFFSSAVTQALLLAVCLAIMVKFGWLDFSLFRVGFNLILVLTAVYVWGIWAVAARRAYSVAKWQAFVGTIVPVVVLLIFIFIFDKMMSSKLETWITPLK